MAKLPKSLPPTSFPSSYLRRTAELEKALKTIDQHYDACCDATTFGEMHGFNEEFLGLVTIYIPVILVRFYSTIIIPTSDPKDSEEIFCKPI